MVKETIEAIKESEAKAEQIIREASEQGKTFIDQANEQAKSRVEKAKNAIRQKEIQAEGAREKDGTVYLENALKEAEEEVMSLKQMAEQKAQEAIDLIVSQLV
ncbi:MAG: hypothetical protein KH020_00315 [Clostridiales bacterium]|nr:hypothetical protein [Clostridiales bacterium]